MDPGSGSGGIARDVETAVRSVFQSWAAEDLRPVDHEAGPSPPKTSQQPRTVSAKQERSPGSTTSRRWSSFLRTSTHLATLTSSLEVVREAAHPNVRPMLDFFHFWSGLSKFDDLDLLQPGELAHAHFQDLLDTPRELINNDARLIPGDGIAPVVRILQKLKEKQYNRSAFGRVVPSGAGEGGSIPGRHRDPPEVRNRDAPGTGLVARDRADP